MYKIGKFYDLKDLYHGAVGGHVISKGIVNGYFIDDKQNGYLKILIGRLWEKGAGEAAWLPSNLFAHFKRALELSISDRTNPLTILEQILGTLGQDDHH